MSDEIVEISKLQSEVILHKEALVYLTSRKYKHCYEKRLEVLNNFKHEIENTESFVPMYDLKLVSEEDCKIALHRMKKIIKLLQILLIKVNCPVSKIVDSI